MERGGALGRDGVWIDWASAPLEAWTKGREGGVAPAPLPAARLEAMRQSATDRVAAWTKARVTYGFLAPHVARRRGLPDAASPLADADVTLALKLVRFAGREDRQTGFVCEQTSQFRMHDLANEIALLGAKGKGKGEEDKKSKRRLCDVLGAALLGAGRLLSPLETVLVGL